MQRCNVTVRLGGSVLNTVPKTGVSPAEILVLQAIHGPDAVVDIRPTDFDKKTRDNEEFARLAAAYDRRAGGFAEAPDAAVDEGRSILRRLFPGAVKQLPKTLEEIGLGHLVADEPVAPAPAPAPEPASEPEAEKLTPDELAGIEGGPEQNPEAETTDQPGAGAPAETPVTE